MSGVVYSISVISSISVRHLTVKAKEEATQKLTMKLEAALAETA